MAVQKGDIIKVEYEGRLEDGTIFDSTELNDGLPLKFEVGKRELIQGFDDAVIGKEMGDEFEVTIQPDQAYGDFDPALTQDIDRTQFPEDIIPEPGMMLRIDGPNNTYSVAWIKDVGDDNVTIDMNHPLAGKILSFKIKIVETGCEPDPIEACGCGCDCDHEH